MASIINASTTSGVVVSSDQSGILNLQAAGNTVATVNTTSLSATAIVPTGSTVPTYGIYSAAANTVSFSTSGVSVGSFDSAGRLQVGTTSGGGQISALGTASVPMDIRCTSTNDMIYMWGNTGGSAGTAIYIIPIRTGSTATLQGGIYWSGSVLSLATSSDYRLKENVQPLTNCLDKVNQLNPVSYTWKEQKTSGKGFIAHELQAVIPEAVVGEKDAVDEDGNIKPQSIDQTQLIVYLTKAIQELKAEVDALKAGK